MLGREASLPNMIKLSAIECARILDGCPTMR